MIDKALKENYAYHRAQGRGAALALRCARVDVLDGKRRYGATAYVSYNPRLSCYGFKDCCFVENAANGLRLVGFADDMGLRSIQHRGWYTDEYGDNTLRGVVYQLPGRNGEAQYVYGYADPDNDGSAFLSFDVETIKEQAARYADNLAMRAAEKEREYQVGWQAGSDYVELGEDISRARGEALELLIERKDVMRSSALRYSAILANVRAQVSMLRRQMREAYEKRENLLECYGDTDGFKEHVSA